MIHPFILTHFGSSQLVNLVKQNKAKGAIRLAFLQLLGSKPLNLISVAEIRGRLIWGGMQKLRQLIAKCLYEVLES
ncbi:hypothetical protein PATY110618_20455 [Paenibacillus typhae]|uniref:Uncharacterized protein n=1 Tax=Paenibacillus typhae TaxID=1174501 RepID=A0A1G9ACT4_9BACL|nr:hypothetical protein SAMN05216192_13618 [Paenibacillus typhae]